MRSLVLLSLILCFSAQARLEKGFVYCSDWVKPLKVELRYLTPDNFVGGPVDGYQANRCIMTKPAAKALATVASELEPYGLGLKVFDAYRPQKAVNHFVRWARALEKTEMKWKYYPREPKTDLFSKGYIADKSGHSRGSTLDLTLIDLHTGNELDMGSGWDFFGKESWPSYTALTPEQRAHRLLLRRFMMDAGFKPYEQEWWHFTLDKEPYPKDYFDFDVE